MSLPRCEDWDSDSFLVPSILTGKSAEVIKKYYNTLKTIQDMKLFDDPGEDEGLPYDKGVKYMVAVILRQDLDDEVLVAYLEYAKENFKRMLSMYTLVIDPIRCVTDTVNTP